MSAEAIPLPVQRRVRLRAGQRCEYCRIPQAGQEATFHIDHIVPRRDGGPTILENLALSCVSCSLRKGARIEARDPSSGDIAPLFHPRELPWRFVDGSPAAGTRSEDRLTGWATGRGGPLAHSRSADPPICARAFDPPCRPPPSPPEETPAAQRLSFNDCHGSPPMPHLHSTQAS